jgi:catechol 2,3-dioxygenase-like lactoylglutathione lyase family enzyme/predicted enzyme related to lactoylglutathione lyase
MTPFANRSARVKIPFMRIKQIAGPLSLCLFASLLAGQSRASRPKITGLAFVRFHVTDLAASRKFYEQIIQLGNHINHCLGPGSVCFRLNSAENLELVQGNVPNNGSFLEEVGFSTDNLDAMHHYLAASGAKVGEIFSGYDDRKRFELTDPENHRVAFVSAPLPGEFFAWSTQIAKHMLHAGFVVHDLAVENHFYRDLLGFHLYWQGGFKDDGLDWYEIQVPDGTDWIEYMLNIPANADHAELGVQNHFSLGVNDIHATAGQLRKNGLEKFDGPEIGRDGKWSLDAYDPDGTRIEFMEFRPAKEPCCHPYTADHPNP